MEIVNEERLVYLTRQVAHMRLTGVKRHELAEIALETLVTKLQIETLIKDKSALKQRHQLEMNLKRISELEHGIASLYFIGRLKGEQWARSSVFSSLVKRFPYEKEK